MKSHITAIGTAVPPYQITQSQVADFMSNALEIDPEESRRLRALYRATGIHTRHTVLSDYTHTSGDFEFYGNNPGMEPFPSIDQRMELYRKNATPLCIQAIENCFEQMPGFAKERVTHLITVSCTGMYAPGVDIEIVEQVGLPTNVQRTAINFMGCYAAFPALKAADHICRANPNAVVLIVCVELCSIHFQKHNTDDHLLANALFADGAAAVLVQSTPTPGSLYIESFHGDLISVGKKDMAWHISNFGFEMTLSAYVPDLIEQGIQVLTENLFRNLTVSLEDISLFAIHPGGKRILEVIEKQLALSPEDNYHAYEILRNYGNMSSPTVLFVLQSIQKTLETSDKGKRILSFAFGPGLTLESMLLQVN
ncbi:type III polyketide synthase [Cytophagaceae bacterium YF14B1]|uniref:Type III polyketide synthase n=1 Tax=Xanthocytophaga flava TaxID=3048013 RepID=A0AAE3QY21_9BACT|nr:type III polyketide synthase [Xanthocytophaga flavus]MDJ1485660.1 type III polyketide synthase [Xanthocytophaga flavus]